MPSLTWRSVLDALRRQGWALRRTGQRHWRAAPPDPARPVVFFGDHGNDPRAIRNALRDLRRSGFCWGGPDLGRAGADFDGTDDRIPVASIPDIGLTIDFTGFVLYRHRPDGSVEVLRSEILPPAPKPGGR